MENNLQKANEIIKRLAEYSRKYPPGMHYEQGHVSHKIAAEIEQMAKDYVDAEPEPMTPNKELTAEEVCLAITHRILDKHGFAINRTNLLIAKEMFDELWPYVGKAFEAGIAHIYFNEGPGDYAPDKTDFLTQSLTELKTKADANP